MFISIPNKPTTFQGVCHDWNDTSHDWLTPSFDDVMTWIGFPHYWPFMMTSSNGDIFRVTGHLWGEFTGHRWIPRTKASDAELWCLLWFALNKRLSKQSCDWWFETQSHPLWRHCNIMRRYQWFPSQRPVMWSVDVFPAASRNNLCIILHMQQVYDDCVSEQWTYNAHGVTIKLHLHQNILSWWTNCSDSRHLL